MVDRILAEHPAPLLAVEVVGRGYRVSSEFPAGELHGEIEVVSVDELAGSDVTRVIVRDPNASEEEFIELAHRLGLEGVSYAIGYTAWLDIAPEGVDKAHGLARVCGRMGIDAADVLAIGDGRNDIDMFEWAASGGGAAIAMGQAPDEVKDVATEVTGTDLEQGVASALARHFQA